MTDRELMQQALEAMGAVGADWICEASHHAKKDQHKLGEPCPLQQRWHIAYQALRERLAQPEQEPVALETVYDTIIQWYENDGKCSRRELARRIVALYAAPRQWQGLTDEDVKSIWRDIDGSEGLLMRFVRVIEAKLKERNI